MLVDLNYTWLIIECPYCNYQGEIQLIDAKSNKTIFCHNCKVSIHLKDETASVYTGIENINKAFKDLENLCKKFSR